MILHPFQVAATQYLEGYWGPTKMARAAMASRARLHLERKAHYVEELLVREDNLDDLKQPNGELGPSALVPALEAGEFETAAKAYPPDAWRILPTRLGNVLRHYEDLAGRPYGLDAVVVVPHLLELAPRTQADYVDDTRTQLDLSVRFVLAWLIVAVTSFLLLWPYGAWLLVPLASYALAWISYRGAIHAARDYGNALFVLIDLNQHLLHERFRVVKAGDHWLVRAEQINSVARRDYD